MLKKQNNAGFTLTEMIIVLAVTSIFFTIVLKIGSMININQELVNQKQAETSEINNILFQLETLIDSSNQKLYKIEILSTTDGFIINSLEDNQIKHSFEFNQNAKDKDMKATIDKKIDNAKNADIIMIDDIDSVGFHYAAEGYYKLFDKIRALEKTVILTSNKSYSNLMNSLNIKTRKDNIEEIKGRLTSRLKNLNIIEIEMQKFEIKSDKLAS